MTISRIFGFSVAFYPQLRLCWHQFNGVANVTGRHLNILGATFLLTASCGFGWLAFGQSGVTRTPAETSAPALVVEPGVADLGLVRQNQTLTGTYSVVNRFPVAVDIDSVMKSCSCADAEVEPKHLEPGQTATLRLAWKTGTKRGPASDRVTVVAKTTDPVPRTLFCELRLQCDVQPEVVIEPAEPKFSQGKPESITLTLKNGSTSEVKVTQAFSSTKSIRVAVQVADNSVTVEYDPTVPLADDNAQGQRI